jgi:hypothetical protein
MHYPRGVQLEVADKAMAGTILEVSGTSPISGAGVVELVCRRDQLRDEPPLRVRFETSLQALGQYNTSYRQANDPCWTQRRVAVAEGEFLTALQIPVEARGICHVRMFLHDETGTRYAVGAQDIEITAPRTAALPVKASLEDHGNSVR